MVFSTLSFIECFQRSFPERNGKYLYGKGSEIITPIMESGKVNVLAFIGSSKVANGLKNCIRK
jgi:acyl-CoA reductase-like NAD-dependent aldehyde dehydrogenase